MIWFLAILASYIVVTTANVYMLRTTYSCERHYDSNRLKDPVQYSYKMTDDGAIVWLSMIPVANFIALGHMIRARCDEQHNMYKKFRILESKTALDNLESKYQNLVAERRSRIERELGIS